MMPVTEVSRMPKVTLYVKDADAPIWERAKKLAGDSLSAVVSRALASYVNQEEARARAQDELGKSAEQIVIDVEPHDRPRRKVRFTGVLAVEGDHGPYGLFVDAYVTTTGKIVLVYNDKRPGGLRVDDVTVFDNYKEFVNSTPSETLLAAVSETIGEEWIEDIE